MIVRNEEAVLERCLQAARNVVDEICIVDTGSKDRTLEIAHSFGAETLESSWDNDFSAARNKSLGLASGDWILVLDADEVIEDNARKKLAEFAKSHPMIQGSASQSVGQVCILDSGNEEAGLEASSTWITRFFPRNGDPKYQGKIHEQLTFAGRSLERTRTGVRVCHDGYTNSSLGSKDKLSRNLSMLQAALAADGRDAYLWWQLGRTHAVAGRQERALEAFTTALDFVEPEASYLASLCEGACYALRALEKYEEAFRLISQVSGAFQERADTVFLEALLAMDIGQIQKAEAGFQKALQLGDIEPLGGPSSPSASGSAPAYNLGVLREVTGQSAQARTYYEKALLFDPVHQPSLQGLERLQAQ